MSAAPTCRTLAVTGAIALVCALAVASAQVLLRPLIGANIAAEQAKRMAGMLDTIPGLEALLGGRGVAALEPYLVDLATGAPVPGDPLGFDPIAVAEDPETGRALPPEADIAGLGRIAHQGVVYLIRDEAGALALVIVPVRAQGYQSMIQGMLALEPDLATVAALTITAQAETPGLGARIQTPQWQGLWPGRALADDSGTLAITVVQGRASQAHEVDGITGATRSAQAVGNAVRFWLGPEGYGPYLARLAEEEGLR